MFFCQSIPLPLLPAQLLPGLHCLQMVAKSPPTPQPGTLEPREVWLRLTLGCTSAGHSVFAPTIPSPVGTDILLDADTQKELWQILYFQAQGKCLYKIIGFLWRIWRFSNLTGYGQHYRSSSWKRHAVDLSPEQCWVEIASLGKKNGGDREGKKHCIGNRDIG